MLLVRFTDDDRKPTQQAPPRPESPQQPQADPKMRGSSNKAQTTSNTLESATTEELQAELQRRLEDEQDDDEPYFASWSKAPFPERVVIIGSGPAGLSAALYAARAGLTPLVLAPQEGGQLQGKGVDVENYPGVHPIQTGPAMVQTMKEQAALFGAVFEDDVVTSLDASQRPLVVHTNHSGTIETHTVIVATGATANWLDAPGEWELRGNGVSSCATCDGFLYSGKHVVVVGGGDAAMEDALVLARTSKSVRIVHRRDKFRASKVLSDRVLNHRPKIVVEWNATITEIVGHYKVDEDGNDTDEQEVHSIIMADVNTGAKRMCETNAVFVAIGHTPATSFLEGIVEFNPDHPGYIWVSDHSTHTSAPGIFAAGDVADPTYRQAITSAGSGAMAALDAERYLSEHGLGNEKAKFEAELLAELQAEEDRSDAYLRGINESEAEEL